MLRLSHGADPGRVMAAEMVMNLITGVTPFTEEGKGIDRKLVFEAHGRTYHVRLGTECLRCGEALDRDESIQLGFGPDCADRLGLGHEYRLPHQKKRAVIREGADISAAIASGDAAALAAAVEAAKARVEDAGDPPPGDNPRIPDRAKLMQAKLDAVVPPPPKLEAPEKQTCPNCKEEYADGWEHRQNCVALPDTWKEMLTVSWQPTEGIEVLAAR
jgi:hypothetical protein